MRSRGRRPPGTRGRRNSGTAAPTAAITDWTGRQARDQSGYADSPCTRVTTLLTNATLFCDRVRKRCATAVPRATLRRTKARPFGIPRWTYHCGAVLYTSVTRSCNNQSARDADRRTGPHHHEHVDTGERIKRHPAPLVSRRCRRTRGRWSSGCGARLPVGACRTIPPLALRSAGCAPRRKSKASPGELTHCDSHTRTARAWHYLSRAARD
jgi:hypothetical protein